MSHNPLQQFFRQPKVYINLPSKGAYNREGVIQGNAENLPVYGMTGMDEILIKTPDALFSGESTVKVIESCVPGIKDAWNVSNLDLDLILTAIRIATYGNTMEIEHSCPNCKELNDYTIDLSRMIDHYGTCTYFNKVVLKDLVVKLRPLTYREITTLTMENARLTKQIADAGANALAENGEQELARLYQEMAVLQNRIVSLGIECVEVGNTVVTERPFIDEWLANCDKIVLDAIKQEFAKNREVWDTPSHPVTCEACGHESSIRISMDHSSFFVSA